MGAGGIESSKPTDQWRVGWLWPRATQYKTQTGDSHLRTLRIHRRHQLHVLPLHTNVEVMQPLVPPFTPHAIIQPSPSDEKTKQPVQTLPPTLLLHGFARGKSGKQRNRRETRTTGPDPLGRYLGFDRTFTLMTIGREEGFVSSPPHRLTAIVTGRAGITWSISRSDMCSGHGVFPLLNGFVAPRTYLDLPSCIYM
jgi:hypothetical protein